jgi:hypothetical protein
VCTIGTVGSSACGKCVGERVSVLTGWDRVGGGSEGGGKSGCIGTESILEGDQWIVAQEKEGR